uniref:hypothetical protein n=1 Tax=Raoultella terrigena TaxID=577 RepID=UPI001330558B
ELTETDPEAGRWLVAALEECAGAVAGAAASVTAALVEHELLSLEVSGVDAPSDWVSDGRLGVILGIRLPGRSTGHYVEGVRVDVLSVTPLRQDELALIADEGPQGRQRVAEALVSSGWYSYADAERHSVL